MRPVSILMLILLALSATDAFAQQRRLSTMGPPGDAGWDAGDTAIAYNPVDDVFLVAWSGEDDGQGQVVGEHEIFVQQVDGRTGAEVGPDDVRISAFQGLGSAAHDASTSSAERASPMSTESTLVWSAPAPRLAARRLRA